MGHHEGQFRKIYGIRKWNSNSYRRSSPTARLTHKTETIGITNLMKSTNEKEWIEVMNKSKKVRFMKQDQFGKTTK